MKLTHQQIRDRFRNFYTKNNHKEVPAIPLVPKDDPTTLFTGSGMQQFVPYLLGETHPQGTRLFNIQPAFRAGDIEEIGDNRHTTFFEMIGNWSLGDYFKQEQITWLYTFLTDEKNGLGLPKERLYITVFEGYNTIPKDKESYEIWKKLGVPDERIHFYGPGKNWWSRAGTPDQMPPGEPGGPDSEVFYEFPNVKHDPQFGETCHPNCDCGRFMEVCNSVFMEYKKNDDGSFSKLPKKNVDFGGGMERFVAAVNDDPDIFKSSLFQPIVKKIQEATGASYETNEKSFRIISDHLKASVFIIKNGVIPSNKEQGYVLRRLLRRAAIKYRSLVKDSAAYDFLPIVQGVIETYKDIYLEHSDDVAIASVVNEELKRFTSTLEKGLREANKIGEIDGKKAFDLYQSYGFPFEITEELFREKGQHINKHQFREEFEKHKNLSRTASAGMFKGGLADHSEQVLKYHTATHLLHQALFDVLGNDVKQEGSNITGERLRFDFSAGHKPTPEETKQITEIINTKIKESLPVQFEIMPKEKAYEVGAKSFFREKYPDNVKVYFVGYDLKSAYSKEFCGGPHVKNTKEIGPIELYKLEKIGSNMYRIYAK